MSTSQHKLPALDIDLEIDEFAPRLAMEFSEGGSGGCGGCGSTGCHGSTRSPTPQEVHPS